MFSWVRMESNDASQLAATIINNRISKDHPQNKVNKNDLPQLNKSISVFPLKWKQNTKDEIPKNQNQFIPKQDLPQDLHPIYVCIY